ncbi:MAG: TetR family transcriptional regulator [Solirubrobacterales bacterium]|nr:TetR family transcriptional regulator [Solirubrobacterales bacterium]
MSGSGKTADRRQGRDRQPARTEGARAGIHRPGGGRRRGSNLRGDRTRRRLLQAARDELLARSGHLEVGSVSRRAKVAPSVLYHHFDSKAGLVGEVVGAFYQRLHTEVLDHDPGAVGDWFARERERARRGVRFHYGEPLAPVVYGPLSRDPGVASIEGRAITAAIDRTGHEIERAQRAGELPRGVDSALAAAAIFGAMRQLLAEAMSRARRPREALVVERLWLVSAAAVAQSGDGKPARRSRAKPRGRAR